VAFASTHYVYALKDGQAELAWLAAGLNTETVQQQRVTHLLLTGPNMVQLH